MPVIPFFWKKKCAFCGKRIPSEETYCSGACEASNRLKERIEILEELSE